MLKCCRLRRHKAPLKSLVSFKFAPSYQQAPPELVIGKNTVDIPENTVPAYVIPEFATEDEERALMKLTNPWFDRLPYNDNHVDSLIHHYKEFYRPYDELMTTANLTDPSVKDAAPISEKDTLLIRQVLQRCRDRAQTFLPKIPIDDRVHFLRLDGSGFIRAHVDESRNSSGIVAGLCLNSARVMTLTHPEHPGERIELFLQPRAFYVMIGTARYVWEHSVDWTEDDDEHIRRIKKSLVSDGSPVTFDGNETDYTRGSRTAVIFRGVSPMTLLAQRMEQRKAAK